MILGIIGGVIDALFGLLVIFGGVMAGSLTGADIPGIEQLESSGVTMGMVSGIAVVMGIVVLLVATLVIIGGAIAQKKPVVAGILMIIGGVLNFFGGLPGVLVGLLIVAGGILALVGANQGKTPAAPPAPTA